MGGVWGRTDSAADTENGFFPQPTPGGRVQAGWRRGRRDAGRIQAAESLRV